MIQEESKCSTSELYIDKIQLLVLKTDMLLELGELEKAEESMRKLREYSEVDPEIECLLHEILFLKEDVNALSNLRRLTQSCPLNYRI